MELCQRSYCSLIIELEIDTGGRGEAPSIKQSLPYATHEEVACQLYKTRKLDVVQPVKSPWASPMMLVNKERQMLTILH